MTKVSDSEEYFGFVLNGDHLYLTDTFLVTHNTGLGKTFVLLHLLRTLGLKAVVMAPSKSIAMQIYDECAKALGTKYVGLFGNGKKQSNKLITVAIAASLTNVEEGTQAWDDLSKAQVFIADESHLCPAQTLSKVCFGLLQNASYRFFFSGTQMRSDGLGLVLDAITGPMVMSMTVKEGVDQGFLAKPIFRMISMNSKLNYDSSDANAMTRVHLYYNPEVNAAAGNVANQAVGLMGKQTLILVDEIEQFMHLLPHLRHEARFAHGGVNAGNKGKLAEKYHDSDPKALVAEFNAGKFPILVGTSCVAIGTDFKGVECCIYLRGGKSEVEVKQSVGRCTRKVGDKEECLFVDFAIRNVPILDRHAKARQEIYEEIYPSYREMKI